MQKSERKKRLDKLIGKYLFLFTPFSKRNSHSPILRGGKNPSRYLPLLLIMDSSTQART